MVQIENLLTYLYVQSYGLKVIESLAREFKTVELVEQCSDFFKLKVPRGENTIGSLFGLIEDKKADCAISEYSVSQTSLEQIFQNFANVSIEEKAALTFELSPTDHLVLLNPDKKKCISQNIDGSEKPLASKSKVFDDMDKTDDEKLLQH